jgi:D-alanyl-D-alanine carboxypeptidase-like protein
VRASDAAVSVTASVDAEADAKSSAEPAPPALVTCLARHYVGRAVRKGEGWALALPSGATVAYDDGRTKTMEERIADPDIEDVFAVPYVPGAIAPVTDREHDPGRARIEPLFRAVYGESAAEVEASLVRVSFAGHAIRIHKRVAEPLTRVAARIERAIGQDPSLARFFKSLGGTFNPRTIAGTDRTSAHAWGVAIDIDPALSDYWRNRPDPKWTNRIPQAIVDAFEAEHFAWGGRWFHYDTMHFEYRPELFDPDCKPG